ncbi:MAG: phospholipase C [Thermoprotei archaeon]
MKKHPVRGFIIFIALVLPLIFGLVPNISAQVTPTKTPIKHVIFIMKENQSFDDYFGTYPYGFNNTLANNSIVKQLSVPYGIQGNTEKIKVPNYPGLGWLFGYSHLKYNGGPIQVNPGEGWVDYHGDWNWAKMNGFAAYSGTQSLTYVSYQQIPYYWDYAEEYVLADNYFSPVMTETLPNRLASLCGYTPVSNDYGPPPYVPLNYTIFYQLSQGGVSWAYFQLYSTTRNPPPNETYPLNAIKGFDGNPAYADNDENISVFFAEAHNGSLPAVSFVMPFGLYGEGNVPDVSEHPPANITLGQLWTVSIVNAVMKSPDWNSSVIFITWDEWGGFYDNVPPPQVNGFGYGGRVPLLIISPYAKENYVDSEVMNHDSILNFIDYNWGLPYLTGWVADSGSVLNAFDFAQVPRAPIILGPGGPYAPNTYPIPLQVPLRDLNYSSPPFRMPTSTYAFSIPPPWLASTQFFLILASVVLLMSGMVTSLKRLNELRAGLLIAVVALGLATSFLGLIYTAIPPTPAPPTEPTYSFLTAMGFVMLAIGIAALAFPPIKKIIEKASAPQAAVKGAKITAAIGLIAVVASLILTPGVVFPEPGITPSPLNPPETYVGMLAAMISPLTAAGFGITLTGGLALLLPLILTGRFSRKNLK